MLTNCLKVLWRPTTRKVAARNLGIAIKELLKRIIEVFISSKKCHDVSCNRNTKEVEKHAVMICGDSASRGCSESNRKAYPKKTAVARYSLGSLAQEAA